MYVCLFAYKNIGKVLQVQKLCKVFYTLIRILPLPSVLKKISHSMKRLKYLYACRFSAENMFDHDFSQGRQPNTRSQSLHFTVCPTKTNLALFALKSQSTCKNMVYSCQQNIRRTKKADIFCVCFFAISEFAIVNMVFLCAHVRVLHRKVVSCAACNKQTRNPIVPSSVKAFKIHVSVINLVRIVNVFILKTCGFSLNLEQQ